MTTDYVSETGCPRPFLEAIAQAGFSHVHWCQEWDTDYVYADEEIGQIGRWMRDCKLGLTDLHGSAGRLASWGSLLEHERLAGVELVKNRIDMARRLGADVVIMHLPAQPGQVVAANPFWEGMFESLDALKPCARDRDVRIALENGSFEPIEGLLSRYGPDFLGLCYDSGHGNTAGDGLDQLERMKDRLISIHIHDNDGKSDQHRLPFTGTVDWQRLAGIIASSSYGKWVNLEATMHNSPIRDETRYLQEAFEAGSRLSGMIEECRQRP